VRGPANDSAPTPVQQPSTTATTAPAAPDPAWLQVPLHDAAYQQVLAATGGDSQAAPLLTARLPSGRVAVLVATERVDPRLWVAGATLASDQPGAHAVSGTSGHFPSYDSLIAVPVRDGDRTVLVVLLPSRLGDTVEATSSLPGQPVRRTSAFVHDRFALVPVTSPEAVTRVRVLARGRAVVDTIPAGSLLGPDVPRTVDRVVTTSGGPPNQPVQVRTDGRTACRLTVGGFWDGPAYVPWNPFDAACAPADGRLHLLLAADRRYSSVAGLAPAGAATVRLSWRHGSPTELPVTADSVAPAFVDNSGRPPLELVRAEALDASGTVVASVTVVAP
jgi:hypothetical protein